MSDSTGDKILDIMAKHLEIEREKLNPETSLQSMGADSLLMVEIIFDLEECFDINIPDPESVSEHQQQFKTASDIIRTVKELITEQGKSA